MDILRQDTIVLPLSDMHSGGSTALFLPRFWQGLHVNHTPTKEQKKMFRHFQKCADIIAEKRRGKRLVVVHDGDAIDGMFSKTPQSVTRSKNEQIEIHIELMDFFLRTVGFEKENGDRLYYVTGTEVHVNDAEHDIGKDLDAEMDGDKYAFDFLPLDVNGRLLWFAHHGPNVGKGANKGNSLYNSLKNLHYDCQDDNIKEPDVVISGHVHKPHYETFSYWEDDNISVMHGLILPSWQKKTRYAYKVAPKAVNKIGMAYFEITAEGNIIQPRFELLKDSTKPIMV